MKLIADFIVPGLAQPGGSKKAFPIYKGKGLQRKFVRAVVTEDGKHTPEWKATVAAFARANYLAEPIIGVPLMLIIEIIRPRLATHHGSGKNAGLLKSTAPALPITKPDCTKLMRSTEDALTGIIWHDDSQIAMQWVEKRYGSKPGARIRVYELPQNNPINFAEQLATIAEREG